MSIDSESPWAKPLVAKELGRRLRLVAHRMNSVIVRQHFPIQFTSSLNRVLHSPGKLFASKAAKGYPITEIDLSLWSLPIILAHAATSDSGIPSAPLSSWRNVAPVAAAGEFLGLALDLIDDIQDGDSQIVEQLGLPIALNVALALLGLTEAAIDDVQTPIALRVPLHTMFTSAMLAATAGQYLDLIYEHRKRVTTDAALDMTIRKSGSLIGLLFQVGAFVGFFTKMEVEDAQVLSENFTEFGRILGTIAQLENDVRDAYSLDSSSNKSDRKRKKKTLPLVFEMELTGKSNNSDSEIVKASVRFTDYLADMYRIQALDLLDHLAASHNVRSGVLRWLIAEREEIS